MTPPKLFLYWFIMALDTYSNLKIAIQKWTRRNDIDAHVDDVIDLCETEIYSNDQQILFLRSFETRSTASTSTTSRFLALPDDYIGFRQIRLVLADSFPDLIYKSPEQLFVLDRTGMPVHFTVTSQIEFDRVSDVVYTCEVSYYKKPTALSSSNQTNDVLTNHPNIYLFGCQWATYIYASEEQKAELAYARFIKAIVGANERDEFGRYGPAPVMRIEGCVP